MSSGILEMRTYTFHLPLFIFYFFNRNNMYFLSGFAKTDAHYDIYYDPRINKNNSFIYFLGQIYTVFRSIEARAGEILRKRIVEKLLSRYIYIY